MEAKPSFRKKEMIIRTIGDLKELLKDVPDKLVIGYVDLLGDDEVMIWKEKQTGWVNID